MNKQKKGYILVARKIVDSDIFKNKPPEYLKVWIYLLEKANFKKGKHKVGENFCSTSELQDVLSYKVGYRTMRPSKKKIWGIIDWLRRNDEGNDEGNNEGNNKAPMIETTKVTHGFIYKVLNYAKYQDPKNYEGNSEGNGKNGAKVTPKEQRRNDEGNNNSEEEEKNVKNGEEKDTVGKPDPIPFDEIVGYLNEKTGKRFRPTSKATQRLIKGRWNEGYRLEDFKKVIDVKTADWLNDPKMDEFLRPSTLFAPTNFEAYLNIKGGKNDAKNGGRAKKGKWDKYAIRAGDE